MLGSGLLVGTEVAMGGLELHVVKAMTAGPHLIGTCSRKTGIPVISS